MTNPGEISRFGAHGNAFGLLRLLFASLVIVSHVPEIVDGDRHRELLSRIFPSQSFGIFAVNGFFVISGYLICGSYLNSSSAWSYLQKRVVRIYPAFVVASLVALLVVAPLAGGHGQHGVLRTGAQALFHLAMLCRPTTHGAFAAQHESEWAVALDGAMWTIQYEFACYLLVIALGWTTLLRRRVLIAALAALLLGVSALMSDAGPRHFGWDELFPGSPSALPRLTGLFVAGAAFHLFRDRIPYRRDWAIAAAMLFVIGLRIEVLANMAFGTVGAYLIFYMALHGGAAWTRRVNNENDISYGLYLYAWPVEKLLIMYLGGGSLLLLGGLTWLIAAACGWASWRVVEKPAMAWLRGRRTTRVAIARAPG